MLSIQKNKSKNKTNKVQEVDTKKLKSKSTQKSLSKTTKSQSTLQKNANIHEKYSPFHTVTVSTHKQKPFLSIEKNTKKLCHNQSYQRISSKYDSKQFNPKAQTNKQKKEIKYIFNPVTNSKNRNSLTINRQKSPQLSHSKSSFNPFPNKHVPSQSNDLSSFAKSIQLTKMKKKSHDYIKSFNKTSGFDKQSSKLENTLADDMNQTCKFGKTWTHGENSQKVRQFKITDEQLDEVSVESCPKISQIRQNVNNLFKKLKQPNRNKLLLITNNYEKIVSQLYQKINNNQNFDLPDYDVSKIEENHLIFEAISGSTTKKQNIIKVNDSSSSTSAMIEDNSDSQHWDSYLQIDNFQKQNAHTFYGSKCKQNINLVKKLNLGDIKKDQIKQYQDEFMDNQEIFSESWKREINQQKRF